MRIGSLFSGYGGLDMAVQAVLGGTVAWYSEIEPAACRVLEAHLPGVPNLGDVTTVDWSAVEPVDVLTGGYPCQPFSHAGKRKGTNDERHLWPYVRDALAALCPMVAVFENVDGHRSLGLADVLGDLADLGLSARWGVVRAADAGAPHGRKRVFIVAYSEGWGWGAGTGPAAASRGHVTKGTGDCCAESAADPDIAGSQGADAGVDVAAGWVAAGGHTAEGVDRSAADAGSGPLTGPAVPAERGYGPAADADGNGHGSQLHPRGMGRVEGQAAGGASEWQRARREPDAGSFDAAADAVSARAGLHGADGGRGRQPGGTHGTTLLRPDDWTLGADRSDASGVVAADADGSIAVGELSNGIPSGGLASSVDLPVMWGKYAAAIYRWERTLRRPAPAPTILGTNGRPRLSPVFVEWMMGLPEGHVTGHGLSNAQALKMLGNGVVPQQAALALHLLGVAS